MHGGSTTYNASVTELIPLPWLSQTHTLLSYDCWTGAAPYNTLTLDNMWSLVRYRFDNLPKGTYDILDAGGTVIRSYSSDDPRLEPDPALDPEGYDRICQQDPGAPNCRVPLYWPAPQMLVSTRRGMHRFSWDLHFEPLGEEPRAGGGATGAVPGRTYPRVDAPWAPPGEYTVRLTVGGQTFTQPLSLRLDPRVTTPAEDLELLASLSREMWDGATAADAAYQEARAMVAELDAAGTPEAAARKAKIEALAPPPAPGGFGGFGRRGGAPSGPPTLQSVSQAMMSAAMAKQEGEVRPTARQIAACEAARAQYQDVMGRGAGMVRR